MIYFISLALLIYVSAGNDRRLLQTFPDVKGCIKADLTVQNADCAAEYNAALSFVNEVGICDRSNTVPFPDGICTSTCAKDANVCGQVGIYMPELSDLTCQDDQNGLGPICKGTFTPQTTSAPQSTAPRGTGTTDPGATDPCTGMSAQDIGCTTATDCDSLRQCMSAEANDELGNDAAACSSSFCTVTCNNGDNVCTTAQSEIERITGSSLGFKLTCQGDTDKLCGIPVSTPQTTDGSSTQGTGTSSAPTPVDRDCTEAEDCEAKLQPLVAAIVLDISGSDLGSAANPALIKERYICVNNICTVTCNDPTNSLFPPITGNELCDYVTTAINKNGAETVDLVCDTTGGSGPDKVCVQKGDGTGGVTDAPITDITLDCEHSPCANGLRDDCAVVAPVEVADMCSVRIEYDIDVCIMHRGFLRSSITREIRDACIAIAGTADDVCPGGGWEMEAYQCYRQAGAVFDFKQYPEDEGECPQDVQKACGDDIQQNRAANIKGAVGLYCPCENTADLTDIKNKLIRNANRAVQFGEECLGLSITDDEICHEGFGAIEANTLTITFRNANGDVVDVIDIHGNGAAHVYYYMASVVVLIVVSLL